MSRAGRLSCFVLLCVTLICATAFAQDQEPLDRSRPLKSTTGAVLRSMVVPGWGQFYNESYYKAIAFAIIEGFQIDGMIRMNDKMNAAKKVDFHPEQYDAVTQADEYKAALSANAAAGQDVIRYRERRNKTVWWFIGTMLLSMGDAYVDAQLYGIDVSPDLSLKRGMTVGLTASINF